MNTAELVYGLNEYVRDKDIIKCIIDTYIEYAEDNNGHYGIDTGSMFEGIYDNCSNILDEYAKSFASAEEIEEGSVYWGEYRSEIEEELLQWRNDISNLIKLNFEALGYDVYKFGDLLVLDGNYENVQHNIYIKKKAVLDTVMTFSEATKKYELDDSTLRKAIDRFRDYEVKKSGGTWLVTKEGMDRLYE